MLPLFPEISINHEYRLKVDDIHELYIEESGNTNGVPVVFLHDGPSIGANSYYRRFFDAECYRVVQFDLRGSGRSTPYAETLQNTTPNLIKDILAVSEFLKLDRFLLVGVGFGASLAVDFSRKYSDMLLGLVLVNVADYSESSADWLFGEGATNVFSDLWLEFGRKTAFLPEECLFSRLSAKEVLQDLDKKLAGENELVQIQVARAWVEWMFGVSSFHPDKKRVEALSHSHSALAVAKIHTHYFLSQGFQLTPKPEDEGAVWLRSCPCTLIHGRYNMVSPVSSALALQHHIEGAELQLIRDAGHSLRSPALVDALVRTTNAFSNKLGPEGA